MKIFLHKLWIGSDELQDTVRYLITKYSKQPETKDIISDFTFPAFPLPVLIAKKKLAGAIKDFEELKNEGKNRFGFIFNTNSNEGKHWVAFYVNIISLEIKYFDSFEDLFPSILEHNKNLS